MFDLGAFVEWLELGRIQVSDSLMPVTDNSATHVQ